MRGLMYKRSLRVLPLAFILISCAVFTTVNAQDPYSRTDAMIAMRDAVKLNTHIYAPTRANEKFPILLLRTPYGIGNATPAQIAASLPELTAEGFIVVQQDIRGRFSSEGQFVMLRQPRDPKDKNAIDESSDTYDTIDWLLKNVPNNNGNVGIAGTSYGAWLSVMAMLDPHPALKAVVEQASPADMWIGDDFHHNGAFRLSYGLEYGYMMESGKEIADVSKVVDTFDVYDWYLKLGSLANVDAKYFNGKIPSWRDFVNRPDYDDFWKRQAFAPWLNRVTVPTLNVAGWWDQEDFYGPIKIYELLERHDTAKQNFLVVGPWNHGGWSRGEGRKLGRIDCDLGAIGLLQHELILHEVADQLHEQRVGRLLDLVEDACLGRKGLEPAQETSCGELARGRRRENGIVAPERIRVVAKRANGRDCGFLYIDFPRLFQLRQVKALSNGDAPPLGSDEELPLDLIVGWAANNMVAELRLNDG